MQQVKAFLNFIDFLVGTFWGLTLVETIPFLLNNNLIDDTTTKLTKIIQLMFLIAGFVYFIFRIINFVKLSKINIDIKRQELRKLERDNFPANWNDEFIKGK